MPVRTKMAEFETLLLVWRCHLRNRTPSLWAYSLDEVLPTTTIDRLKLEAGTVLEACKSRKLDPERLDAQRQWDVPVGRHRLLHLLSSWACSCATTDPAKPGSVSCPREKAAELETLLLDWRRHLQETVPDLAGCFRDEILPRATIDRMKLEAGTILEASNEQRLDSEWLEAQEQWVVPVGPLLLLPLLLSWASSSATTTPATPDSVSCPREKTGELEMLLLDWRRHLQKTTPAFVGSPRDEVLPKVTIDIMMLEAGTILKAHNERKLDEEWLETQEQWVVPAGRLLLLPLLISWASSPATTVPSATS
ncbi:hypothetical protein JCM11491_003972 [Sporobolomyces phaffii]